MNPWIALLTGDYTRSFNRSYDHLVIRTGAEKASRVLYAGDSEEKPGAPR